MRIISIDSRTFSCIRLRCGLVTIICFVDCLIRDCLALREDCCFIPSVSRTTRLQSCCLSTVCTQHLSQAQSSVTSCSSSVACRSYLLFIAASPPILFAFERPALRHALHLSRAAVTCYLSLLLLRSCSPLSVQRYVMLSPDAYRSCPAIRCCFFSDLVRLQASCVTSCSHLTRSAVALLFVAASSPILFAFKRTAFMPCSSPVVFAAAFSYSSLPVLLTSATFASSAT